MTRDDVVHDYFEWLCDLACKDRYSKYISYRKLLIHLHKTDFYAMMPGDQNREEDGIGLRSRFAYTYHAPAASETFLYDECSVLEMMLGLAIRCEETIMDDPKFGDRSRQWFWGMVTSLGLGSMTDDSYDADYVSFVLDRFLERQYEPNGKGGLFTIRNCDSDLRDVEIWYQMCWYLDSIT